MRTPKKTVRWRSPLAMFRSPDRRSVQTDRTPEIPDPRHEASGPRRPAPRAGVPTTILVEAVDAETEPEPEPEPEQLASSDVEAPVGAQRPRSTTV